MHAVAGRRCFVPQAIDQDPYFRLCRRVAEDWLLDGSGAVDVEMHKSK